MLALIAFSLNAAIQAHFSPNAANNPNITVPYTTAVHLWDLKKPHTQYLIWSGPPQYHHGTNPVTEDLFGPLQTHGNPPGYWPVDVRSAYNVSALRGSKAIVVVDYSDYPTALADFNVFAKQFNLPQETSTSVTSATNSVFQVVYEHGTKPSTSDTGWNGEAALDMEWAHAMAPNAKIYMVESDDGNLDYCNQVASALLNTKEVSNSWSYPGENIGASELSLDQYYVKPGVVFLASAGDVGALQGYPATSKNVIGIGGTTINIADNTGIVTSETAWADSGGGPSAYETIPSFQAGIASVSTQLAGMRGSPDISAIADPATGVAVYVNGAWNQYGGTSVACPVCAGIVNDWSTQQGIFQNSSAAENSVIYSLLGSNHFRDIVSGTASGPTGSFTAHAGWDFITGVGTPLDLRNLPTFYGFQPYGASTISGKYMSGNAASIMTAGDSNYYVVNGTVQPGLGVVADVRALFTVTGQPQSEIQAATVTIFASGNTPNAVNEVFMYNWASKTYDLVGTPVLPQSNGQITVNLNQAAAKAYIDTAGDVIVLSRALLPQRLITGSNSKYVYKVDSINVSYGYLQ